MSCFDKIFGCICNINQENEKDNKIKDLENQLNLYKSKEIDDIKKRLDKIENNFITKDLFEIEIKSIKDTIRNSNK